MKRSWFGVLLLVALLLLSLLVTWVMGEIHAPVAERLRQAAALALEENWEEAGAAAMEARQHWKAWAHLRQCFADHTPVEDIESQFAQLTAYEAKKETAEFAAACLSLKERVEAMAEAHGLSPWNLL